MGEVGTKTNFAADEIGMKDDFNSDTMKKGERENKPVRNNYAHQILQLTQVWHISYNLSRNNIFGSTIYMLPVGLT